MRNYFDNTSVSIFCLEITEILQIIYEETIYIINVYAFKIGDWLGS